MRVDVWIPQWQMLLSVFDGLLLLRFITNKRHGGGVVDEDLLVLRAGSPTIARYINTLHKIFRAIIKRAYVRP